MTREATEDSTAGTSTKEEGTAESKAQVFWFFFYFKSPLEDLDINCYLQFVQLLLTIALIAQE